MDNMIGWLWPVQGLRHLVDHFEEEPKQNRSTYTEVFQISTENIAEDIQKEFGKSGLGLILNPKVKITGKVWEAKSGNSAN